MLRVAAFVCCAIVGFVSLVGSDGQVPTLPELSKLQDFARKQNLELLVFEWGGRVHYVRGNDIKLVSRSTAESASIGHHAYPSLSPDCKYVAVVRTAGSGKEAISTYSFTDGTLSDLHSWDGDLYGLSWSPMGGQIALVADEPDSRSLLRVLDIRNGDVIELVPSRLGIQGRISIDSPPSWSPDGKKVAFEIDQTAGGPYKRVVAIVDVISQEASVLTEGESPSWSPNGDIIAYYDLKKRDVHTIKPDGSGKKKLFSPYSLLGGPAWPGGLSLPLLWSADEPIVGYNEIVGEGPTYSFSVRNLKNGKRQRVYANSRLAVVAWRKAQNRD